MSQAEPLIRNISDTARLAAVYRARETERADGLFRDPLARRLAGDRGEQIAAVMPASNRHTWAWVTRTYLFDQYLAEELQQGADMVVNLAAGLDARPYRMALPATLQWVEVDLPELFSYKEPLLAGEKPACVLERIPLDLADAESRRSLFARLGKRARHIVVLTEGLLVYLTRDMVGALADDLSAAGFERWILDLMSPRLLHLLQRTIGGPLGEARAHLQFAPPEGPAFFEGHGWQVREIRSPLKTAKRLKRLPWFLRLISWLPDSQGRRPNRPWSGICLLARP